MIFHYKLKEKKNLFHIVLSKHDMFEINLVKGCQHRIKLQWTPFVETSHICLMMDWS